VDITLFIGTIGLFVFLFLLFVRFLPMITMFEVKNVTPQADPHHHGHPADAPHAGSHSAPAKAHA
jgi:molybdopterin-containing oxidoreductase family membrane subunit